MHSGAATAAGQPQPAGGLQPSCPQLPTLAEAGGRRRAEPRFPRCCRRAPRAGAQVQSPETWSAREKGVGDDESEAPALLAPSPPDRALERTGWLGRRGVPT